MMRAGDRVRVKICGLKTAESVEAAVSWGADAVGFVFAPSPRRVAPERAALLAQLIPPFVVKVAVFDRPDEEDLRRVMDSLAPDRLQFEASALAGIGREFRPRCLPVFHDGPDLPGDRDLLAGSTFKGFDTILLDGPRSGHGERADWSRAAAIARQTRVILAGGLNPENVGAAIRIVHPYGVDVSSGVESAPGVKDPKCIAAFVAAVREAEVNR